MAEIDLPSKQWLEQAQYYKQPFTVTRDGEAYKVTVEKIEVEE